METFNIISMNTGILKGTIQGVDLQDAETKCLNKGLDMYDKYMLVHISEGLTEYKPNAHAIINR